MQASFKQEIVNDTAKLMMHRLIARLLVRDPLLLERARVSLGPNVGPFSRSILCRGMGRAASPLTAAASLLLTSCNQHMRRLRLSSPFVTAEGVDFRDRKLRLRIRRAAKRIVARIARRAGGHNQDTRPRAA